jgi:hypothetical protein
MFELLAKRIIRFMVPLTASAWNGSDCCKLLILAAFACKLVICCCRCMIIREENSLIFKWRYFEYCQ